MSGVYVLLRNWDAVYIGQSSNIIRRVTEHHKKDYDHYVLIPCSNRTEIERNLIRLTKPQMNVQSIDTAKETITVRVDESIFDYLEKQAEKQEWTLSFFVNKVLSNYMKRAK